MFVCESLRLANVPHEAIAMIAAGVLITERVLVAHVNFIWLSRKMYSVPNLEVHCWRNRIDILHRNVLSWSIIDVRVLLKFSQKI